MLRGGRARARSLYLSVGGSRDFYLHAWEVSETLSIAVYKKRNRVSVVVVVVL